MEDLARFGRSSGDVEAAVPDVERDASLGPAQVHVEVAARVANHGHGQVDSPEAEVDVGFDVPVFQD